MSKSLLSAIFSIIASKVGVILITILYTPLLVRFLGPEEYGQYAVIISVVVLTSNVATAGVNDSVRKYLPEHPGSEWRSSIFGYISRIWSSIVVLIGFGFIFLAHFGLIELVLGPDYVLAFYIVGLYVITRQGYEFVRRSLMGLQLESYSEPIKFFRHGLFASLAVFAAYTGYSVEGVLMAEVIASSAAVLFGGTILARQISLTSVFSKPTVTIPTRSIQWYIGGTIVFYGFLQSLYHVDVLFLEYWISGEVVGYYKGALSITEALLAGPVAIQMVLLQRTSKLWEQGKIDVIQDRASTISRYVILLSSLMALGIGALAYDFVPIYLGSEYAPASAPLILLLPGVVGFAVARPIIAINQGRRSLQPLIIATGACAILNTILNVLLIPHYGMLGAAIATSVGYSSLVLFQAITAHKLGYAPFSNLKMGSIISTLSATTLVIFSLATIINSSVISLLVVPPVGAITCFVISIMTGAAKPSELESIMRILPSRAQKPIRCTIRIIPKM